MLRVRALPTCSDAYEMDEQQGKSAAEDAYLVCSRKTQALSPPNDSPDCSATVQPTCQRLGIFAQKEIPPNTLIERCYARSIPAWQAHEDFLWSCGAFHTKYAQLREAGTAENSQISKILIPFGWGMLYSDSACVGLEPNITWHVEEVTDPLPSEECNLQGRPCWIVLKARQTACILEGQELVIARGWNASAEALGLDIISYALELLEPRNLERPIASTVAMDHIFDSHLSHPAACGLSIRESERHGIGAFASRSFKSGEVVEISPVIVFADSEVPSYSGSLSEFSHTLEDYIFEGGFPGCRISCLPLGFGAVYNHSGARANLEQRWAYAKSTISSPLSFSYSFIARRDIESGEELLLDYGKDYWDVRGLLQPG